MLSLDWWLEINLVQFTKEGVVDPPSVSSISRLLRGSSGSDRKDDSRRDYSIHGILGGEIDIAWLNYASSTASRVKSFVGAIGDEWSPNPTTYTCPRHFDRSERISGKESEREDFTPTQTDLEIGKFFIILTHFELLKIFIIKFKKFKPPWSFFALHVQIMEIFSCIKRFVYEPLWD